MKWLRMKNAVCITDVELEALRSGLPPEELEMFNESVGVGVEVSVEEVAEIGMAKMAKLSTTQVAVLKKFKSICQLMKMAETFADVINLSTSPDHMMSLSVLAVKAIEAGVGKANEPQSGVVNKEDMH